MKMIMKIGQFLKKDFYLFIFTEGKGGRKGEKHQGVGASQVPPNGDLDGKPGTYSDWKSKW